MDLEIKRNYHFTSDREAMGYAGSIDHARPKPVADYKRRKFESNSI